MNITNKSPIKLNFDWKLKHILNNKEMDIVSEKRFIVSEVADVLLKANSTGEIKFEGKAKTHNFDKDTDKVVVFTTENYAVPIGFDKEDEKFKKFIDEWNDIGCTSFSKLALGEEVFNKVIEESKKVEEVEYPPQIQLIIDTIKDYEKEVRKTDLSNSITDVSYHNGIYHTIEDILEIIKFSVR